QEPQAEGDHDADQVACRRLADRRAEGTVKEAPAVGGGQRGQNRGQRGPGRAQQHQPAQQLPGHREGGEAERTEPEPPPGQLARGAAEHGVPVISSSAAVNSSATSWNSGVRMIDRSRGRRKGSSRTSRTRPGRLDSTMTLSARNSASSTEWVTRSVVILASA